jgi:chromosomal replication initiator protein
MTLQQGKQVWDSVLGSLQLQVTRPSYETWLKDTVGIGYRNGEFVVGTPSAFVAEMLEQRMYSLISQAMERVTSDCVALRFEVVQAESGSNGSGSFGSRYPEPASLAANGGRENGVDAGGSGTGFAGLEHRIAPLNPRYTFDTFIVGKSNELAHAAAKAVADKPGVVYNPLVMYSDAGLGKTHLLHAIGSQVQSSGLSLIYATTEEFTNEYIKAIRDGTTEEFRNRYRGIDILLLDDIQFLIGKEQTQEGFFHSFNALHMANRQIVITSDRPVTALTLLEERVSSRLAGGLVVDIQPPDLETRLAILRAKVDLIGHPVASEVLGFLSERVYKNIRELEGTLNRVVAYAQLTGSPVTLDLVKRITDQMAPVGSGARVSDQVILDAVASYYGVSTDELKGRKRDKKTALARQVCMYLLRDVANLGLTAIGRILGGKDHTTVHYGCERIATQVNTDTHLRRAIIDIRDSLVRA